MPMKTIQSLEDLNRFRKRVLTARKRQAGSGDVRVIVSLGSCGIAAGALDTLKAIQQEIDDLHLGKVILSQTGCVGLCKYEPIVDVITAGSATVTYGRVTPEVARHILRDHVMDGRVVEEFVVEA